MSGKVSTKTQLYFNLFIRIPAQVIQFVISILLARILMPRDFGILGVVMILVGYANIFTNLGFNQAIVQRQIREKKILDSIFTVDLTISVFLTVLFFYLSGPIAIFFDTPECKEVVQVMSLVFILTSFHAMPHGVLRRDMRFRSFAIIESSQRLLTSAVSLFLALYGFGYWALAYGQIIPLAFIAIILCVTAKWYPSIYYKHGMMKGIYDFGLWSFLKIQFIFISQHVDKLIIGRWLGPMSLGFYDKSKTIAKLPIDSVLMNINAVMFSSFSKNQSSIIDLQYQLRKSFALTAIISYPIYTGLILITPYFVSALLGEKWIPMINSFQIILFGSIFKSFSGITSSFNVAVGKYRSHSLRLLAMVPIFTITCFALLKFELIGIAWSFVIFCVLSFLVDTSLTISESRSSWIMIFKVLLAGILPTALIGIIVWAISFFFLTEFSVFNFIILSITGSVTYSIFLFFDPNKASNEVRDIILKDLKRVAGLTK